MVRFWMVVGAVVMALAPAANAAEVTVADRALSASSAHAIWNAAVIKDTTGHADDVTARLPRPGHANIKNSAGLTPGLPAGVGACVVGPFGVEANCVGACQPDPLGVDFCLGPLSGLSVSLGGGNDRIVASGFDAQWLAGGPGRDYLQAVDGDTVFVTWDDADVDRIRCGTGTDDLLIGAEDIVLNPAACD